MALGTPGNIQFIDSTTVDSDTWSVSYSSAGSGRHIIACTSARQPSGNPPIDKSLISATYNAASLTKGHAQLAIQAVDTAGTAEVWFKKDPASGTNTLLRTFPGPPQAGDASSVTFEITGGADAIVGAVAGGSFLNTLSPTVNITTTAANSVIVIAVAYAGAEFSAWNNSVQNIYSASKVNRSLGAFAVGYRSVTSAGTYTVGYDSASSAADSTLVAVELKESTAPGGETIQGAWVAGATGAFTSSRTAIFSAGFVGSGSSGDQSAKRADMLASMLASGSASVAAAAAMQAVKAVSAGAQAGESWVASMEALSALMAAGQSSDIWESLSSSAEVGSLTSQSQASAEFVSAVQMLASLQEGATASDAILAVATIAASLMGAATSAADWAGDQLTENQATFASSAIGSDAWSVLTTVAAMVLSNTSSGDAFSAIVSQLGAEIIESATASAAWSVATGNSASWVSSSVAGSIFSYPGAGYLIATIIITAALSGRISVLPVQQGSVNVLSE